MTLLDTVPNVKECLLEIKTRNIYSRTHTRAPKMPKLFAIANFYSRIHSNPRGESDEKLKGSFGKLRESGDSISSIRYLSLCFHRLIAKIFFSPPFYLASRDGSVARDEISNSGPEIPGLRSKAEDRYDPLLRNMRRFLDVFPKRKLRRIISVTAITRYLSRDNDKRWQVQPCAREININGICAGKGGAKGGR